MINLISESDTPYNLDSVYCSFRPIEIDTSFTVDSIYIPVVEEKRDEGSELKLSGVKDFTFDINEGFDQGLKLYATGELEGVKIKGVLSDQGIDQPTRRISDIEKIRLEAWTRNFYGGIGDLSLSLPFEIYDEISGVRLGVNANNKGLNLSYALSRGKYIRYEFSGEEGKQGPYFLPGRLVYNSEKIYLSDKINPPKLLSKEYDYEIDYEQGIINFKNRNIITHNSYIIVEYLEANDDYQNVYQEVDGKYNFSEFLFTFIYHRFYDVKDNPLNFQFTPEEIESLKISGDEMKIKHIYADTSSTGSYNLIDGKFVYAGEGKGHYRVSFFYVGENNGDYVYDPNIKGFVYVGENFGNYTPEKYIPLPGDERFYGIGLSHKFGISTRIYSSYVDKNSFSSLDDEDNSAFGYEIAVNKKVGIFSVNSRYINFQDNLYQPKGRQDLNYNYQWNISETMKELFEFGMGIAPYDYLNFELTYGLLNKVHKRRSMYIKPLFFYLGVEQIDTLNKYTIGLRKSINNLTLYTQYLNQQNGHYTDYNFNYRFREDRSIGLSGNYERNILCRAMLTKFDLLIRQLNLSTGFRLFNDTTLIFVNANSNFYYKGFGLNFQLEQSQKYAQKKDEAYIHVAPGTGNYVYDPITGVYIPKENGDYIKQTVLLKEFQRVLSKNYFIESSFTYGLFDLRGRFFYLDEEQFIERKQEANFNITNNDAHFEIILQEEFSKDKRYALEPIEMHQYHFSFNPEYKNFYNYNIIDYSREFWGGFLKLKRDDYGSSVALQVIEQPQAKPILSYKYSRLFSDFYPDLILILQTPSAGLTLSSAIRGQGRIELTGELIYRKYNVEDIPYLYSANEPPGFSEVINFTSSLGIGNNTIFSFIYRIQLFAEGEPIQNLRFQTRIKF
uniref:Uncharacterized protein n=1 Tax=candidate division WOR-3 bacterium TaxID=2052148 RepID=A0A7V3RHP6_UNCW3